MRYNTPHCTAFVWDLRGGVSPTRERGVIAGCHHTAFLSVVLSRQRVFDTQRGWRRLTAHCATPKFRDCVFFQHAEGLAEGCHISCVSETRHLINTILSDQRERSVVTLYTSHTSVSETRHQICALCRIRKDKTGKDCHLLYWRG